MFFPIDVVFVDEEGRVVFLKEKVKPWTAIFPIKDAKSVYELPISTISKYKIKVGDKILT